MGLKAQCLFGYRALAFPNRARKVKFVPQPPSPFFSRKGQRHTMASLELLLASCITNAMSAGQVSLNVLRRCLVETPSQSMGYSFVERASANIGTKTKRMDPVLPRQELVHMRGFQSSVVVKKWKSSIQFWITIPVEISRLLTRAKGCIEPVGKPNAFDGPKLHWRGNFAT